MNSFVEAAVQETVEDTAENLGLRGDAGPLLQPEDGQRWAAADGLRDPAGRDDLGQSMRCVYRCPGAE